MHDRRAFCLAIGTSDSSGATGIQSDLKTFTSLDCYGAAIITSVQAQSLSGVRDRSVLPDTSVRAQLEAVCEDLKPTAVKVGLCPSIGHIRIVARWLREHRDAIVVIDPVAADSRGIPVVEPEVIDALRRELLPLATVMTPNRSQATLLLGLGDDLLGQRAVEHAATALFKTFGAPVVITDGGAGGDCRDVLVGMDGMRHFEAVDYPRNPVQGRSSTFSAAMTALLARGDGLREAVLGARLYVAAAIAAAPQYNAKRNPLWHAVPPPESTEKATQAWKRQISGEWKVPADG